MIGFCCLLTLLHHQNTPLIYITVFLHILLVLKFFLHEKFSRNLCDWSFQHPFFLGTDFKINVNKVNGADISLFPFVIFELFHMAPRLEGLIIS